MPSFIRRTSGAVAAAAMLAVPAAAQQQEPQAAGQEMSDEQFIETALQAAPEQLRDRAGVMRPDGTTLQEAEGNVRCTVLSFGALCGDEVFAEWAQAHAEQREDYEAPDQIGLAYMLDGHSQAVSLTDPFATADAGGDTLSEGPHVMILAPQDAMPDLAADHQSGEPYVMWEGTPYAHVMMPVGPRDEAPGVAATPADEAAPAEEEAQD